MFEITSTAWTVNERVKDLQYRIECLENGLNDPDLDHELIHLMLHSSRIELININFYRHNKEAKNG